MVDSGQIERTGEAGIGMTLITLGISMLQGGDTQNVVVGAVLVALGFGLILLREIRKPDASA